MEFKLKYINVFTDINSKHVKDIQDFYNSADLTLEGELSAISFEESNILNYYTKNGVNGDVIASILREYVGLSSDIVNTIAPSIYSELRILVPNENSMKSGVGKIMYWLKHEFRSVINDKESNIFINVKLTKYVIYTIYLISKLSNNIVMIDYNYSADSYKLYNNFNIYNDGTHEHLSINSAVKIDNKDALRILSLKQPSSNRAILFIGEDDNKEINNVLVDLYDEYKDSREVCLLVNGINSVVVDQIYKLYQFSNELAQTNYSGDIITKAKSVIIAGNYGNSTVGDYKQAMLDYLSKVWDVKQSNSQNGQQIVQFIAQVITFGLNHSTYIIYGPVSRTNKSFINFLVSIGKTVYVIDTYDKSQQFIDGNWAIIEVGKPSIYHQYPKAKVTYTTAFNASQEIKKVLDMSSFGFSRDREVKTCNVVDIRCTKDEVDLMWKEDNLVRPGYSLKGEVATVPSFFNIYLGYCKNYIELLNSQVTEHTIICNGVKSLTNLLGKLDFVVSGGTCRQRTTFNEQKPFIVKGELDYRTIVNHRLFKYGILPADTKLHILSKVNELAKSDKITFRTSRDTFIDEVLTVGLNLSEEVQNFSTWYDYSKQSPKLIVLEQNREVIDLRYNIILELLHLCGWDISIFVPTGYDIIGDGRREKLQEFILGDPKFDCNITEQEIRSYVQPKASQGFFKRLFS